MGFCMAYFSATFVALLITHEIICPVNGQCTIQNCDKNINPLVSVVDEIQQLKVESFDQLSRHAQSASEINAAIQEIKSQLGTVMTSLQDADRRRSREHDIYIKQGQSVHELLNESFQEMKSQHGAINVSLQEVDRRLEDYSIDVNNQTQKSWKLVKDICGPVSPVRDCSDIKARGYTVNGVYEVCVGHTPDQICTNAFCDMETTSVASMVFQRRKDGSVNFNRTWAEYKEGFGNLNGEFWLGNEMLYLLTSRRNYKLRVELENWGGEKRYAEYTRFSLNSSDDNYRLAVIGYSGNAGDSMNYHNGKQFSTIDVDNDEHGSLHCVRTHGGAWWHGACGYSTLNGKYYQRYDAVTASTGIHWTHWISAATSLKATEMKLVPVA